MNAKYNTHAVLSRGGFIGGNGTDRAIAEFFKNEKIPSVTVTHKLPFSSEKKYSAVSFSDGMTLIKGAPELIMSHATHAVDKNGTVVPFSRCEAEKEYINASTQGNRVVAIAYKMKETNNIVFLALVILKDKIRRGVRESVTGVKRAGVHVVMLTGDGKETATAIAKECGIMSSSPSELVMTSQELGKMSDDEVKEIIPRLCVLARALPQDKMRLVRLSQELDLVVGMTGDGINDAPSLKLADVGFAMGNGADIAKSAGDVILLNNSFFSINRTILYGRTIFKSIRKFITFQLIMNLAACGVSVVGQFIGVDSPITIIQMLWVNIIMDTLGGLAFSGEPALEYYMKEKPKRRSEPIMSREMLHQIIFTGAYTLCLCVAYLKLHFFKSLFSSGEICFMTGFYALFIFAGIFNCLGARCERMWIFSNIGKNKAFVFIMTFISVIQIVMIYYGGSVFRTVPLTFREFLSVILISATVVPFEMTRRIFYKLKKR
jgi:calcium-translocating P-type ATPase